MTQFSPTTDATPLDRDVLCVTCGYNLRTQARNGRCPECATAVITSLDAPDLMRDEPKRTRCIRMGSVVFGVGMLLTNLIGLPTSVAVALNPMLVNRVFNPSTFIRVAMNLSAFFYSHVHRGVLFISSLGLLFAIVAASGSKVRQIASVAKWSVPYAAFNLAWQFLFDLIDQRVSISTLLLITYSVVTVFGVCASAFFFGLAKGIHAHNLKLGIAQFIWILPLLACLEYFSQRLSVNNGVRPSGGWFIGCFVTGELANIAFALFVILLAYRLKRSRADDGGSSTQAMA